MQKEFANLGFSNYNFRLPKGYDGTDNGAIHVNFLVFLKKKLKFQI